MKAALELLENQSLQHGSKRSRAQRSPSRSGSIESCRSQDDPPVSNGQNPGNFVQKPLQEELREKLRPTREVQPTPAASVFDKLGVKESKHGPVEPDEVKERPECYEDDDDENLSFTNELKAMEVPVNFRMPIMDKYNRRDDPSDDIKIYKTKLQGQSPAMKCQNFHTTLISDTKRWYNKLKPGSIQSWPQFKREFINAFIGNRTMIPDIVQLNDIWQKEGKTVKSYFKRFSNGINKIKIVTDEKALGALVTGLHTCKTVNRRPTVSW
ncbi:Ribonuclease H [Abeliophyllum distichum]|uniref:Ribonuclease H n=1 Tax=Abeliophyllum distichum TaxID=126358 RepID=A0ABD1UPB4_9LAMI